MKIFSAAQMKQADQATLFSKGITSLELMENAATAVFELLHNRFQGMQIPIHVFCGIGNNGGDGLVIARHLLEHGYRVTTYIVNFSEKRSEEFLENYDRLKTISKVWPTQIKSEEDFPQIESQDLIIDAIFGIGLNRPLISWVAGLIKHINKARCFTISIDIPSGLYDHKGPDDPEGVILASSTITFQMPKLIFYLPETGQYSQDVEVLDIGLDKEFISITSGIANLIGKREASSIYRPRTKFSHKGTYGHSILIGGSYGKIGSVLLSSKASLRIGSGLTTAFIPECGYDIFQTALPEAMVITDEEDDYLNAIEFDVKTDAIGIGMGLGTKEETKEAFKNFIESNEVPLVIDADGLNILAANQDFFNLLKPRTVLTPHPGELKRLIGEWKDDFDKIYKSKALSKKFDCIVVIKGAHTLTIYKDDMYVNTTGNPGMATGGSGDVLTGMITGLIAQGYDALSASVLGVYLHGSAGDLAVQKRAYQGLIASDIIEHIGSAFLELFKADNQPKNTDN